jgi:hypothetical protein
MDFHAFNPPEGGVIQKIPNKNCNFLENGHNNFDCISEIYGDRLSKYNYIDGIFRTLTLCLVYKKACAVS